MKIWIESDVLHGRITGIRRYVQALMQALVYHDADRQYRLFRFLRLGRVNTPAPLKLPERVIRHVPGRIYQALVSADAAPPIESLLFTRPSTFLFPNYQYFPTLSMSKSIVFIYDSTVYLYPETFAGDSIGLRRTIAQAMTHADQIVTISHSAQAELSDRFPHARERISVVAPAVDHDVFFPRRSAEVDAVRGRYGIVGNYFLFVGTLEPRKNLERIVAAFEQRNDPLHTLVLVGGKGWLDGPILAAIAAARQRILVLGHVDADDLPALYSGARVLVWPSLYEGFGLPLLESLACGTPVITARNSSLPEGAGDGAVYVDETDVSAIAGAMSSLVDDDGLRTTLRERGLAHARRFSWAASAHALRQVIERAERS